MKILNILRGLGGEFEITRVLGSIGVAVYIVGTHVFVGWTVFHLNKPFDVVAYCAAFPSGLAIAIGVIATAAGAKDKAVAAAQTVRDTGALPAQPTP